MSIGFCTKFGIVFRIMSASPASFPIIVAKYYKLAIAVGNWVKGSKAYIVTTPIFNCDNPCGSIEIIQPIPHFDSTRRDELTAVFYFLKIDLGGTSFYRHNKTGCEIIDDARRIPYYKSLESENDTDNIPQQGYINGDTALFTRIGEQKGIFNRLIVYRRQILHSGSISPDFVPDADPRTGRLTIKIFINCVW